MQNICIRIAVEKRLLHAIAARDGKPVTAAELSSETGTDELLISESIQAESKLILIEPFPTSTDHACPYIHRSL